MLTWVVILVVVAFLWYFLFLRHAQGGGGGGGLGGAGQFGKARARTLAETGRAVTFQDVAGAEEEKEELEEMVREGKWTELIREIPIRKGDFIQIDPGTVHAIKADTLILETQQNSAITYRLYDYGRLQNGKSRELHIDKSLDVITVPAKSAQESVKSISALEKNELNRIYACEKYTVFKADIDGKASFEQSYPFLAASVLEGEGCVDGVEVRIGDHFIIPNGYGKVEMKGKMSLILSTVEG